MSQGPLCPNLTKKVQKEVSQMANCNLPCVILLGGLSVNLNHLKINHLNLKEYQRVTEFHMLAHIGYYCKIMVFSPFKFKVNIINHPSITNDGGLSNL